MKHLLAAFTLTLATALPVAAADGVVSLPFDGSFEDAKFAVESAIVGRGLVIDYVSHVGEMLARTGPDVGSDVELFKAADIFVFCSARVSRQVMEADPMNIGHCPYGIFIAETAEGVTIGHRAYPAGSMDPVTELLDGILDEAAGG